MRAWLVALVAAVLTLVSLPGTALAAPPGVPSEATARSWLAELAVQPLGSSAGYSREEFPHWWTVDGACNTRETVLVRDGSDVRTDESCAAVSGSWFSPYDGATWTDPADLDIDHVVPLHNAWRTGASSWTLAKREAFANDRNHPQLIAVTDNVNQSKGDQSPDLWKPPLESYWCDYAAMWVAAKHEWGLWVTSAEQAALGSMLDTC